MDIKIYTKNLDSENDIFDVRAVEHLWIDLKVHTNTALNFNARTANKISPLHSLEYLDQKWKDYVTSRIWPVAVPKFPETLFYSQIYNGLAVDWSTRKTVVLMEKDFPQKNPRDGRYHHRPILPTSYYKRGATKNYFVK